MLGDSVSFTWVGVILIFVVWGFVGLLLSMVSVQAFLTGLARFGFIMIALASWGIAIGSVLYNYGYFSNGQGVQSVFAFAFCIAVGISAVGLSAWVETQRMKKQCEIIERIERGL